MCNRIIFTPFLFILIQQLTIAQAIRIPQNTNYPCGISTKLGVTSIEIKWNAPGVKGREGKIWGSNLAYFGKQVLGFGSNVQSPWRAGADECTTIKFSTDVTINGKNIKAGQYALFMELSADSTILIFNKNTSAWGSYFYDDMQDVLSVPTKQLKNQPNMVERLSYNFKNQTDSRVEVSLDWERWSIPFVIEVDLKSNTLTYIKTQMTGELGFDPASLEAAANWCEANDINLEQALNWINSSTSPNLGGRDTFNALKTKSKILVKMGKKDDAEQIFKQALDKATSVELHQYGRELLAQKKLKEAVQVFEMNHKKNNGAWPTNAGLMRGYSAIGDYQKALQFAKLALPQATDDINKAFLEQAIKTLAEGKAI